MKDVKNLACRHIQSHMKLKRNSIAWIKLAKEVPLSTPWTAQKAKEWDSISFQQWIDQNIDDSLARRTLSHSTLLTLGTTAADISFYFIYFLTIP
eukprot:TRINITY_DN1331_c0_g1_i1.p1 TRINITY_DN1331_c0_g1~~TRINITY_DN1331_c0_g1_i1.p1  ORF type:complete len:95 (-),score=2.63 TRINITY_DN1331_c0_g1_i1:249-533(-)